MEEVQQSAQETQPSLLTMGGAERYALGTPPPQTSPQAKLQVPAATVPSSSSSSSPAIGEAGWMGPGGGGGGSGGGETLSSDCGGASDLQDLGSEEEGSEAEGSESTQVSPVGSGSGSGGGGSWEASFQNGHRGDEGKQEENNTNNSNSSSVGSSAHASPVPIGSTPNFTGEMGISVVIKGVIALQCGWPVQDNGTASL